jgi:hypothetical protein
MEARADDVQLCLSKGAFGNRDAYLLSLGCGTDN